MVQDDLKKLIEKLDRQPDREVSKEAHQRLIEALDKQIKSAPAQGNRND